MPAPIIFRPQYGPFDSMLAQMFLGKMQHNYAVKEREIEIDRLKAEKTADRTYNENKETKTKALAQRQKYLDEERTPILGPRVPIEGETTNVYSGNRFGPKPKDPSKVLKGGYIQFGDKQYPYKIGPDGQPIADMSKPRDPAATKDDTNLQKDTKTYVKDGKTYKQDRVFDKKLGQYRNVGTPYESKEGVNVTTNVDFKGPAAIRKEFNALPLVKGYSEIRKRYDVMQRAMKEAETTGSYIAVDQALITTFNKITDPDSVVRESEYARTAEDMSLVSRVGALVSRIAKGGRLIPRERKAITRMAERFMAGAQKAYDERHEEYSGYMEDAGFNSKNQLKKLTPYNQTQEKSYDDMTQDEILDLLSNIKIGQ